MIVIRTCADFYQFVTVDQRPSRQFVACLGTVLGGRFRLDWLGSFVAVDAERDRDAVFELTSRYHRARVRAALTRLGDRLKIALAAPKDAQRGLQVQTAFVTCHHRWLCKVGRSPTRMGEILGCGMSIVANDGVGAVARIICDHHVGVLAKGSDRQAMAATWTNLMALLDGSDLASRCRKAAAEVFSLQAGTASSARNYQYLAQGHLPCVD